MENDCALRVNGQNNGRDGKCMSYKIKLQPGSTIKIRTDSGMQYVGTLLQGLEVKIEKERQLGCRQEESRVGNPFRTRTISNPCETWPPGGEVSWNTYKTPFIGVLMYQ